MSNVLIGIVGVILFIGLALAGASFFGPITTDSIAQAKAGTITKALSATVTGVALRNRELETVTAAASSADSLVPTYIEDVQSNIVTGAPILLTSAIGSSSTGIAAYAVTSLGSDEAAADVCRFVNASAGNGDAPGDVSQLVTTSRAGCGVKAQGVGPYGAAEYVAYQKIF